MAHSARKNTNKVAPGWLALPFLCLFSIASADTENLYQEHCAKCHGVDRLGASGPALIPEFFDRMRGPGISGVILNGRFGTRMPAFADQVSATEAELLATYLNTPLPDTPLWGAEQIRASRVMSGRDNVGNAPEQVSDPMDITLVVETEGHHISVLDSKSLEVLDRFQVPFVVPNGVQFSPDGQYAYILSRNGMVQKYDIRALKSVGRVRAGQNSSAIALSHDGKWLAVANDLPGTLTFLNAGDLSFAEIVPVLGKDGTPSRVSAMHLAPLRKRFVLALRDVSEVWEVFYGPNPPFYGFVHDYRVEGPIGEKEPFPLRRMTRVDYLDEFFFDRSFEYIVGSSRGGSGGIVFDLVIGQKIADLDLRGVPFPGSGATWETGGSSVLAAPQRSGNSISVIETGNWGVLKRIKTEGAGTFIRTHDNSPYVWADVFSGQNRVAFHVIDKQTLEVVKTLRPGHGAVIADMAFTRDGARVLIATEGKDGAIISYDAHSLEEMERLPMEKPQRLFNLSNATNMPDAE